MRCLYQAGDLIEAELIVHTLQSAGIPAQLNNQYNQGAAGELPVAYPEVWLKRDLDLERAELVLAQLRAAEKLPDTICARCEESNPGSFELCWQCGGDL